MYMYTHMCCTVVYVVHVRTHVLYSSVCCTCTHTCAVQQCMLYMYTHMYCTAAVYVDEYTSHKVNCHQVLFFQQLFPLWISAFTFDVPFCQHCFSNYFSKVLLYCAIFEGLSIHTCVCICNAMLLQIYIISTHLYVCMPYYISIYI